MGDIFQRVLIRLLSPLVRYLIEQNWTYQAFCELLKKIYIAEALRHDQASNPQLPATDSRVSLLTGIHRKDVKRLRAELAREPNAPLLSKSAGLAVRCVSIWVEQYCDAQGRPKALPFREDQGAESFEGLVKELKADMRAKSILDELVRAGVTEIDAQGRVHLLRSAYVSQLPEDKLAFLGDNVGDHLNSALTNVRAPEQPPFVERAVFLNNLPTSELPKIQATIQQQGDALLHDIHRRLLATRAAGADDQDKSRVRFGIFYYEESQDKQK